MTNSISIEHIGKCYKLYDSRNDRLKEWLLPFTGSRHREKWVLKDVSLHVRPGEAVGIIGMNGAGKSTLLKIITGTTVPTTGKVAFHGTVAALLELGLGFHPDFTGRQNVYMSGQLLGYTLEEITACMQQVEDFAEIGEAIDAPVRTYSSGMQVRLAFSVATMKRPDILIVDEALSVGDAYFQHKSFGRIKEFCNSGTTLLLVSHDAAAIQAVCQRVILLDHGEVIKIGAPEEIMDYYNALLGGNGQGKIETVHVDGHVKTVSGSRDVALEDVELLDADGRPLSQVPVGARVTLVIRARVARDLDYINAGFSLKDNLGQIHFGTNTKMMKKPLQHLKAGQRIICTYHLTMEVGEGNYSIGTAFVGDQTHTEANYEWTEYAKVFQVVNTKRYPFAGYTHLPCELTVEVQ